MSQHAISDCLIEDLIPLHCNSGWDCQICKGDKRFESWNRETTALHDGEMRSKESEEVLLFFLKTENGQRSNYKEEITLLILVSCASVCTEKTKKCW